MVKVHSILEARWVVPIIPRNVVYENYAVVIQFGLIEDILPIEESRKMYTSDHVVCLTEHVVLPGLINAHTHAAMNLLRGYSDDKDLNEWLTQDIWPAEGKFVGPEFCSDGIKIACAEMIRGGTTCFNDMYFSIDASLQQIQAIQMRAVIGLPVFDFPTSAGSCASDYLSKAKEFLSVQIPKLTDKSLVGFSMAPHAPYTVKDSDYIHVSELAKEYNVLVHSHIQETKDEFMNSQSMNRSGRMCHMSDQACSPIQNMKSMRVLENMICAHCVHVSDEDIHSLAETHASVVHNPSSNMKLASGICRVQEMLNEGVNVCLGTDSSASNNSLDMFGEMKLAALLGKLALGDPKSVDAMTALEMATIRGAKALQISERVGSIEKSKEADLIAVNMGCAECYPVYNVISHLVYVVGREQVSHTMVQGKLLMDNRKLVTIDEQELAEISEKWKARLSDFKKGKLE